MPFSSHSVATLQLHLASASRSLGIKCSELRLCSPLGFRNARMLKLPLSSLSLALPRHCPSLSLSSLYSKSAAAPTTAAAASPTAPPSPAGVTKNRDDVASRPEVTTPAKCACRHLVNLVGSEAGDEVLGRPVAGDELRCHEPEELEVLLL